MKNYIDHNRMPIIYGDWIVVGLTSLAHELQNIYEIYFCSSVGNDLRRGSHEASPKLILSSYIFNDRTISHFL